MTDWEILSPYLELSRARREEIRRSNPGDYGKQKQECLEVWKEMKGNEATYRALIKAAEEAKFKKMADDVKAVFKKRQSIPPTLSNGTLFASI